MRTPQMSLAVALPCKRTLCLYEMKPDEQTRGEQVPYYSAGSKALKVGMQVRLKTIELGVEEGGCARREQVHAPRSGGARHVLLLTALATPQAKGERAPPRRLLGGGGCLTPGGGRQQ